MSSPAGVGKNTCKRTIEIPQELGRSCRFLGNSRPELPGDQLQASAAHSPAEERTERVRPRYRQAKATKRGGMGGGKSQCLDITDEAGELDPQEPGGWEARHRVTTSLVRNTWEALNSRLVSPKRQRIAKTGSLRRHVVGEAKGLLEEPDALM